MIDWFLRCNLGTDLLLGVLGAVIGSGATYLYRVIVVDPRREEMMLARYMADDDADMERH